MNFNVGDKCGLSARRVRKIFHRNFKIHSYKMQMVQKLSERDCETRKYLGNDILQNILSTVILTFGGSVINKIFAIGLRITRSFSNNNYTINESWVTVQCVVSDCGAWGLYFFDDLEDIWFQQDSATNQTSHRSTETIRQMFPFHLLSLWTSGDLVDQITWSGDLGNLNIIRIFFLWSYLKAKVYIHTSSVNDHDYVNRIWLTE